MPKIDFSNLPPEIRRHLIDRIRDRLAGVGELKQLMAWIQISPHAPDGDWYKDFGSFKLCGTGRWPKTVLTRDMQPFGKEIE